MEKLVTVERVELGLKLTLTEEGKCFVNIETLLSIRSDESYLRRFLLGSNTELATRAEAESFNIVTGSPVLLFNTKRDEDGELVECDSFFWYPDYINHSPVDILMSDYTVTFTILSDPQDRFKCERCGKVIGYSAEDAQAHVCEKGNSNQ